MKTTQDEEILSEHELAVLSIIINQASNVPTSRQIIKDDLEKKGFTPEAVSIALFSLIQKNKITKGEQAGDYYISKEGVEWVIKNQNQFKLIREK